MNDSNVPTKNKRLNLIYYPSCLDPFTLLLYVYLSVSDKGNRYSIHGETDLEELELSHLDGYRGSKPVRIGNGAAKHLQLDIYGGYPTYHFLSSDE